MKCILFAKKLISQPRILSQCHLWNTCYGRNARTSQVLNCSGHSALKVLTLKRRWRGCPCELQRFPIFTPFTVGEAWWLLCKNNKTTWDKLHRYMYLCEHAKVEHLCLIWPAWAKSQTWSWLQTDAHSRRQKEMAQLVGFLLGQGVVFQIMALVWKVQLL